MKKNISDALPGFVGLNDFFRRLGDRFEPLVLDDDRKDFYIAKIEELRGYPEDLFFNMKWIWRHEPRFREARKYPNGVTMVHFSVGTIESGVEFVPDAQDLMMAFDAEDRLLHYTVMAGNGKFDRGVNVSTFRDARGESEEHDSIDAAARFVRTMHEEDFLIITDLAHPDQFMQVLAGVVGGELVYAVEYCLVNFVLHFALPGYVDVKGVLGLIAALKSGGFACLQDAAQWKQLDVEGYWRSNGKNLRIDIGILAHIYRAEVLKDFERARKMREILDTRRAGEEPLIVKVDCGEQGNFQTRLLRLVKRIALYTELMSREAQNHVRT